MSVKTQLYEEPRSVRIQTYGLTGSKSEEETMLQQRLFNTNEDAKNLPFINTGTSIPISTCKFTKNRSYIDSGISIPISTHKFTMLDYPKDVIYEDYMEFEKQLFTLL